MKKLYTLLFIVTTIVATAQNLVTNPNFDNGLTGWSAGPNTSYTLPSHITNDGSNGMTSVQYVATATTGFFQEIPVTVGSQLTISFYYKASGDDKDARIWSSYKNAANTNFFATEFAVDDPLRTNDLYLETATTWTFKTITVTVPANAVKFVLAFRAYNGGTVAFDQISVVQTSLSTKQNTIAGLNVYPNPVTNGNLFITSNSSQAKSVNLFDVLGKQVLTTKTVNNAVNVSSLKNGAYILKVTEEGKSETKKLIIK